MNVLVDTSVWSLALRRRATRANAAVDEFTDPGGEQRFLICAVAIRHDLPVFTNDRDFMHFKKHLPIKLHEGRA